MIRTKLMLALALSLAVGCPGPSSKDTTPTGGGDDTAAGDSTGAGTETAAPTLDEILATSDLPPPMAQPLDGDRLGVTIHRLSNGLTVYISTDRQKPRFNAWIAVRAGSRHDPAESTGLAHYLEHMLFKGTDEFGTLDISKEQGHLDRIAELYDALRATDDEAKRAEIFAEIDAQTQQSSKYAIPNELDQLYSSLGVTGLNAFTWHEMTVYISDVPSNRLEAWAKLEAERFRDPRFRLFFPELESVYEEKNRSLDNTGRRLMFELHKALYPLHPYGTQPTIGTVEHLKNPAYGDMVDYFDKWYVPNNVAILLAGDIDAETVLPVLESYFAGWQAKPLSTLPESQLPKLQGRSEVVVEAEGENSIMLAWQTVGINHADQPALEVMDFLMSNAGAGLLDVELVLSQKLPRAYSSGTNYLEAGHWVLAGTSREGQSHADVEALLLGVVAKLKAGEFSQEDIDAVVLQAEIKEMGELESNDSRVAKMADAWLMHQDWGYTAKHSERLRTVTVEDVVRVANEYLGGDFVAIKRVKGKFSPPKIDKPKITPIEIDPSKESAFAHGIKEMPAKELAPMWLEEGKNYQRAKLPAGDFIAAKNDTNELFSLTYRFETGSRDEQLLCFALDLMERSGTKELSAEQLQRKLWRMGTSISTGCSVDNVTLRVSGIDRNLEQSVQLLDQWLRTAKLEDEALAKLVENTLSQRKDSMEEPRVVGQALSAYATRAKDSQFLLEPSNKGLQKAKTKALGGLLAKLPDYQHKTAYYGPRAVDDAAKVVALGKKHKKLRARKPVTYRRTKGTQIFFIHKDVAQSQIILFMPKKPLPLTERPIEELYNGYVGGGMGGLIFQEIREARGLAYAAFAGHRAGARPNDESGLMGFIGTQSDKTLDALNTMLELLRQLPMQPERFAKAKESIDQDYRSSRVDPRAITGWVMAWDDLGLAQDPRPQYWETVKTLDEATLKAFADRFANGDVIISIMGDRSRIDMTELAKIGKITEVEVGQLFSY